MTEPDAQSQRRRRAGALPVYPILFAAWFPINAMAQNAALFRLDDLVRPAVFAMAVGLALVLVLSAAARNRHRGALAAALLLVFVVLFDILLGGVQAVAEAAVGDRLSYRAAVIVVAVVFVAMALALRPGAVFTMTVNIAVCAMLALPAVQIARSSLARDGVAAAVAAAAAPERRTLRAAIPAATPRPNIVHIVLDGYSRSDVLAETYGFDNAGFLDRLRSRGFAVADAATTPYNRTLFAMASVLSARYAGDGLPSDTETAELEMVERLQQNDVMAVLDSLGYQIAATDVSYDPARFEEVDRFFAPAARLTNFERTLVQSTAPLRLLTILTVGWENSADRIGRKLDSDPHRALEAPFFLYVHLIAPHPPFDIGADGAGIKQAIRLNLADGSHHAPDDPARQRIYRDGYVAKLRFINGRIGDYVDRVLADVPDPKIVILHGDHGGGMCLDHDDRSRTAAKERYAPLLAVYASDGSVQRDLPADLNLVNLYRHVLNAAFGASLPIIDSRHYFVPWDRPFAPEPVPAGEMAAACAG